MTYETQACRTVALAQVGSQPNRFVLFADGGHHSTHPTKADAIAFGRGLNVQSFEVYDEDDHQVFAEHPEVHPA